MSAAPMNSAISAGLTKRSWKITLDSTPISFAKACKLARDSVALTTKDVRMGRARNHVDHILVPGQNLRQCLDDVFDSLIRREQPEGEKYCFSFHVKPVFIEIGIQKWQIGNAMRNHVDLAARYFEYFLQELGRQLAHHDETIR